MNDRVSSSIAYDANPSPIPHPLPHHDTSALFSRPSVNDDNYDDVEIDDVPGVTDMGGSHGCHGDRSNDSDDQEKAPYPPAASVRKIHLDESSTPGSPSRGRKKTRTPPNESKNPKSPTKDRKKNKTLRNESGSAQRPPRDWGNDGENSKELGAHKSPPRDNEIKASSTPTSPTRVRKENNPSLNVSRSPKSLPRSKKKLETTVNELDPSLSLLRVRDNVKPMNNTLPSSKEEKSGLERETNRNKDKLSPILSEENTACLVVGHTAKKLSVDGIPNPDILTGTENTPSGPVSDTETKMAQVLNVVEQMSSSTMVETLQTIEPAAKENQPNCSLSFEHQFAEPKDECFMQLSNRSLLDVDFAMVSDSLVEYEMHRVKVETEYADIRENTNEVELEKLPSPQLVPPPDAFQDGDRVYPDADSNSQNTKHIAKNHVGEHDIPSTLVSKVEPHDNDTIENNQICNIQTEVAQCHQDDDISVEYESKSLPQAAAVEYGAEGQDKNSTHTDFEKRSRNNELSDLKEPDWPQHSYIRENDVHVPPADCKLAPTEFETNIEDEDDLSETHHADPMYSTDGTESETFDSLETILASPEIYDKTKHFSSADEGSSLTELQSVEEIQYEIEHRERHTDSDKIDAQTDATRSDLAAVSASGLLDNDKEIDDNTINEMKEDSLRSHNVTDANTEPKTLYMDSRETSEIEQAPNSPGVVDNQDMQLTHMAEAVDTSKHKRGSEIICDVIDAYNSEPGTAIGPETMDETPGTPVVESDDLETYENVVESITKSTQEMIMSDEKLVLSLAELDDKVPTIVAVGGDTYDIYDKTPTSDGLPEMLFDEDQAVSTEIKSVSYTESDLDISEQRDDRSSDSMYADDEDDGVGEVLFSRTYTQPGEGGEVLVSCTLVNSALREADPDDFWGDSVDTYDNFKQIEISADAASCAFVDARKQMQEIHIHLQNLRVQMERLHDELETATISPEPELQPLEMLSSETDSKRGITD